MKRFPCFPRGAAAAALALTVAHAACSPTHEPASPPTSLGRADARSSADAASPEAHAASPEGEAALDDASAGADRDMAQEAVAAAPAVSEHTAPLAPPPPSAAPQAAPPPVAALRDAARSKSQPAGAIAAAPEMRMVQPDVYVFTPPSEDRERYQHLDDNPVRVVAEEPVSTFSLDVDTGSYSNVRRFLADGRRPPQDAVRVEELVNYFPYDYPAGDGRHPFGIRTELAPCPWNPQHWLMRVAVRADEIDARTMPASNLVFLVDVSGSMDHPSKLPLLRSSLKLLVDQLRAQDRVSLVVYAGREAVVLEPTAGDQHAAITRAIDQLTAGGSTAGEAGIRLAYRMARQAFIQGGINRVLLATDGDFNVGVTDFEQLKDLVEHERESGVQLSTLGFGGGNYNDMLMEQLADAGNGSYAYIDTLVEGRKVLVDQMRSTLVTVAKDVKVQVEFNPSVVQEYRLIGYENRALAREDFHNDRIDAGDVGAGQTVTALYELTPAGASPSVDPLRYGAVQTAPPVAAVHTAPPPATVRMPPPAAGAAGEVAFVKLRYKQPSASQSVLVEVPVSASSLAASFAAAGEDFRFAAAVAGFGQILRGGKRTGTWTYDDVLATASTARGRDEFGYRSEFLSLVRMAKVGS